MRTKHYLIHMYGTTHNGTKGSNGPSRHVFAKSLRAAKTAIQYITETEKDKYETIEFEKIEVIDGELAERSIDFLPGEEFGV